MPRIRYLKPEFFRDEEIAELTYAARLLYQGLWCHADREGRLRYSIKRIRADIFPYDKKIDIQKLLNELSKNKTNGNPFILIYECDNQSYIQILKFSEHQKIHINEAQSTIPAPTKHPQSTIQAPDKNPGIGKGIENLKGDGEVKGSAEKQSQHKAAPLSSQQKKEQQEARQRDVKSLASSIGKEIPK